MATQRNNHTPEFKAKVALEVLKEQQTLAELGSCYGVHPTLVAQWKRQLREALPQVFIDRRQKPDRTAEQLQAQLSQQIGQLKVELDWLNKKSWLGTLTSSGRRLSPTIRRSLWHGSARWWAWPAPATTTGPWARVPRAWCCCASWTSSIPGRRSTGCGG